MFIKTKSNKKTTVFKRTVIFMISLIAILFFLTGILIGIVIFKSSTETITKSLKQISTAYSKVVEKDIKILEEQMKLISKYITDLPTAINSEETSKLLNEIKDNYNFITLSGIDKDGNTSTEGINVKTLNREYFNRAIKGEFYISSPFLGTDNIINFMVAYPVYKDSQIIGIVIAALDYTYFSNFVNFKIGETGGSYIIDKEGTTVADRNVDYVKNFFNFIKEGNSKGDKYVKETLEKFISGNYETSTYLYDGLSWTVTANPIENTDNWIFITDMTNKEILKTTQIIIIILIVIIILAIIIGILITLKLASTISNPIKLISKRIKLLSDGDLTTPMPSVSTKDEVEDLALNLSLTITDFSNYINEIVNITNCIYNYDLSKFIENEFLGDLQPIKNSINGIINVLNQSLYEINQIADQVANGASQVSDSAQVLAESASEQALTTEKLTKSILGIYSQIEMDLKNASNSRLTILQANNKLKFGNEKMSNMLVAINDISASSKKIENIIKTIENIANQTNLLALNASIEAARAGEAGKGFVVVANEVRSLANKTTEAVKDITQLILNALEAVKNGTNLAHETAEILDSIMVETTKSTMLVDEIYFSCEGQVKVMSEITNGAEQIASVTQNIAATAQQSSATSEELSSQATMLKLLINRFKLK